jgi:acyl-CoA synthetase (AMP-forming)/AMP-acid ligase II
MHRPPPRPEETRIPDLLKARAAERPDALFAAFPDHELSYGTLDAQARRFARALAARGIGPGAHVAVLMPNCPEWLPAYFGALYCGATVVALNARYKRHELAYTIAHSDAQILITTDAIDPFVNFAELIEQTFPDIAGQDPEALALIGAPQLRSVVILGTTLRSGFLSQQAFLARADESDEAAIAEKAAEVAPEDVAVLMYTSGTTSNPKACALSHAAIQRSWYTFAEIVQLTADEPLWAPMPFFHTGGIGPMTAVMSQGGALVTQPHFETEGIVELIRRYRVVHLYSGFPQFSLAVLQHPSYRPDAFSFVRSMLNVGPPAMQETIQKLLPPGAKLLNLFGMTEGSGIVTFTPWDSPLEIRVSNSGRAPAHTQVRIMDPETLAPCAPGEVGEIQFKGGGALRYYYRDPDATAATIIGDGWVRTGDRGKLDEDGWLYYLGRLKDMLKVGGENVAAAEIEFFLCRHPGVKMAQVIGVPDQRMGEVPVAFVERAPGADVDEQALIDMCEGELARWKIPSRVVFVTEWPMSATKVQKFRLAELL